MPQSTDRHFILPTDDGGWLMPAMAITHFRPPERILHLTLCRDQTQLGLQMASPVRVTKSMLASNTFVGQVDNKFLVSVIDDLIVLWDQHALHERIRLELLLERYAPRGVVWRGESRLNQPLLLSTSICTQDLAILHKHHQQLLNCGLRIAGRAVIETPMCFQHLRPHQLPKLVDALVEEMLGVMKAGQVAPPLPATIHQLLCSQACRGAIMFGQPVSSHTAHSLVQAIALCKAPFQCAHGRPSLAPVTTLSSIDCTSNSKTFPNLSVLSVKQSPIRGSVISGCNS